jgi:hypothetical protein
MVAGILKSLRLLDVMVRESGFSGRKRGEIGWFCLLNGTDVTSLTHSFDAGCSEFPGEKWR